MLNKNVIWSTDSFSYTGKVVSETTATLEIETNVGVMCFNKDDGNIAIHEGPLLSVELENEKEVVKSEQKSTGLRNGSKQQLVVEMMKQNPGLERKDYINMIVEQFGMSKAGASTYHQNGKKHI